MNKYIITTAKNHITGLLLEDEKPTELRVYETESELGSIYIGRVSNIVKNINAAFVDIQKGLSCYMSLDDIKNISKIKIGDKLPVQISKEAVKTKQPTVTQKLTITGKYVVLSLFSPIGVSSKIKDNEKREQLKGIFNKCLTDLITKSDKSKLNNDTILYISCIGGVVRTQAENADINEIISEIEILYYKFYDIICKSEYACIYSCMYKPPKSYIEDARFFLDSKDTKLITDIREVINALQETNLDSNLYKENYYEDELCPLNNIYNINGVIDKALSKNVFLKSGAYLVIEPTEAMTVIDVNSGKSIKGNNVEESKHKINLEAAKEIARQLRLRNISGIIMIDFISINNEEKNKELLKTLSEYTAKDSTAVTVVDITRLGLVEITRKKIKKSLYDVFQKKT